MPSKTLFQNNKKARAVKLINEHFDFFEMKIIFKKSIVTNI